jgi:hypothetical protein
MPAVLTTNSTLVCAHGGSVTTSGSTKLKVLNGNVLTISGVPAWSIAGCGQTSGSSKPCTKVLPPLAAGVSTKLRVGGSAAVLATLSGTTEGAPAPGPVTAQSANQGKLVAG